MVEIRLRYVRRVGLLLAVLGLSACGAVGFDIERDIPEQRVEGSVVSSVIDGVFDSPIPMNVDIQRETAQRDGGPAKAVRLSSLSLFITDTARPEGDEDDFAFLDSIEVYVESKRDDSQLPREKIAEQTTISEGATELELHTFEDVNLLPYVEEGAVMTSQATGSAPPDDVTFAGAFVLHVEVL